MISTITLPMHSAVHHGEIKLLHIMASAKSVAEAVLAAAGEILPDGSGRPGLPMQSIWQSKTSFRALPAEVAKITVAIRSARVLGAKGASVRRALMMTNTAAVMPEFMRIRRRKAPSKDVI